MTDTIRRPQGRQPFLGDSPSRLSLMLPAELRARLRAAFQASGQPESEIVRQAIEAELARRNA